MLVEALVKKLLVRQLALISPPILQLAFSAATTCSKLMTMIPVRVLAGNPIPETTPLNCALPALTLSVPHAVRPPLALFVSLMQHSLPDSL